MSFIHFSDTLLKASVHKNLRVTKQKFLGKYLVTNSNKPSEVAQRPRLPSNFFLAS